MIRCDGCHRHVRVTESHCPFCTRSSRRGVVAHKAVQAVGGAVTTIVLAACYGIGDTGKGYGDSGGTETPTGSTNTLTGSTDAQLALTITWTDTDSALPSDTDTNAGNDVNCSTDTVRVEIADPLAQTAWTLGMVEVGSGGWLGEDCLAGQGVYTFCHPVGIDHTLVEVCTAGEVVEGSSTLFDASKEGFLTYVIESGSDCYVTGNDPAYYDALGCEPLQ